jgi:hypothetical protein
MLVTAKAQLGFINQTLKNPMLLSQAKPTGFTKYNVSDDQLLIQRIGMASNLNVSIQRRYVSNNVSKAFRLRCSKCGEYQEVEDLTDFVASANGLVEELEKFCLAHRHTDTPISLVRCPAVRVEPTGRKFREDD